MPLLRRTILPLVLLLLSLHTVAQESSTVQRLREDAQKVETVRLSHRDSVRLFFRPDPMRAVWMGAIIPGYGQIYNRSYWKLPIVYGAFMGCGYAIMWSQGYYTDYRTAYLDLYTDIQASAVTEDADKSYIAILPKGYDLSRVGGAGNWLSTLKSQQSVYHRYRDLSIVAAVLVYGLSLIDAYVDAQLFDYDISPDLSLHVSPELHTDPYRHRSAEMNFALRF